MINYHSTLVVTTMEDDIIIFMTNVSSDTRRYLTTCQLIKCAQNSLASVIVLVVAALRIGYYSFSFWHDSHFIQNIITNAQLPDYMEMVLVLFVVAFIICFVVINYGVTGAFKCWSLHLNAWITFYHCVVVSGL